MMPMAATLSPAGHGRISAPISTVWSIPAWRRIPPTGRPARSSIAAATRRAASRPAWPATVPPARQRAGEVSGAARPAVGLRRQAVERLRLGRPHHRAERHHADHRQAAVARRHPQSRLLRSRSSLTCARGDWSLCWARPRCSPRAASNRRRTRSQRSPLRTLRPAAHRLGRRCGATARIGRRRRRRKARPASTRMVRRRSKTATGDSGAHNPLLAAVASTMTAAHARRAPPTSRAARPSWQEGVNYTRIVPAQPTDVPAGPGRGAGVFLVCLPALLRHRPAGRGVEERPSRPMSPSRACP